MNGRTKKKGMGVFNAEEDNNVTTAKSETGQEARLGFAAPWSGGMRRITKKLGAAGFSMLVSLSALPSH